MSDLRRHIRDIPDFPKPGILFRDITPLLADADAFHSAIDGLIVPFRGRVDLVLGIESRGFIVGAAAAYALGTGIAVVRKPGKLPYRTHRASYELEYGTDSLEIHHDALGHRARVLLIDDLLATGGTMAAGIALLRKIGAIVPATAAMIELTFLNGRKRLDVPFETLVSYDS